MAEAENQRIGWRRGGYCLGADAEGNCSSAEGVYYGCLFMVFAIVNIINSVNDINSIKSINQ